MLKCVYYSFNLYILFTFYTQTWILYLPQKSSVHSKVCFVQNLCLFLCVKVSARWRGLKFHSGTDLQLEAVRGTVLVNQTSENG